MTFPEVQKVHIVVDRLASFHLEDHTSASDFSVVVGLESSCAVASEQSLRFISEPEFGGLLSDSGLIF